MIIEAGYVGLIKLMRKWVEQGMSPEEIGAKMSEEPARSLLGSAKSGGNPMWVEEPVPQATPQISAKAPKKPKVSAEQMDEEWAAARRGGSPDRRGM